MEMLRIMLNWHKGEEGQGSLEWILVVVLVVLAILVAIMQADIAGQMGNAANAIVNWLEEVPPAPPPSP